MRISATISLLLLGTLLLQGADNLLRNAAFSGTSSVPSEWEVGSGNTQRIEEGTLKLEPGAQPVTLIQRQLPLTGGEVYRVRFILSASGGNEYRSYLEWSGGGDGMFDFRPLPAGETQVSYFCRYPTGMEPAYLVIQCTGTEPVILREVSLEHCRPEAGRQELGGNWQLPPGARQTPSSEASVLELPAGPQPAALTDVPVRPGQTYRLSFRAQGLGNAGTTTGYFPLRLEISGITDNLLDDTWSASPQTKEFCFSAPADRINLAFSVGAGTVRFSDLTLEEYQESAAESIRIHLDSPSYRGNLYASQPQEVVTGRLEAAPEFTAARIELVNAAGQTLAAVETGRKDEFRFSLPAATLPIGDYRLQAELSAAGNPPIRTQLPLRKLAPAAQEVIIDADLNCRINGELFLPIVLFTPPELDDAILQTLAAAGINTYFINVNNAEDALEQLDRAHRAGFMVILSSFSLNPPPVPSGPEFDTWRNRIAAMLTPEVLCHPALLAHFLADEPGWTGVSPKTLTAAYRVYCELDPYHPVWINAAPRGSVGDHRRFSAAADIYGLDIYPVPVPNSHSDLADKDLTCIGRYTEQMIEAVEGRKPVWMVLQAFNWHDLMASECVSYGYPTLEQSRFAIWQALGAGARSVSWWGADFALSAEFLDNWLEAVRDVYRFSAMITRGEHRKITFPGQSQTLEGHEWELDGKRLLVWMNASAAPQEAVLPGIGPVQFPAYGVLCSGDELPAVNPPCPEPLPQSPFPAMFERRANRRYLETAANWIWAPALAATPGSQVWLGYDFELAALPERAELLITADDRGKLWLNGAELGATGRIYQLRKIDISDRLQTGVNRLRVSAEDLGGLPCGLLAELRLHYPDGHTELHLSGSHWYSSTAQPAGFPDDQSDPREWEPALVVAPYGQQAWGNRVILPE